MIVTTTTKHLWSSVTQIFCDG